MITDQDIQFHTPSPVPFDWGETGFFNFFIPEENILGWVYIVHRAGVGATVADVEIIDAWSPDIHGALYMNMTNHNPLPLKADDFALEMGLRFKAHSIREYSLEYSAPGIDLKLDVSGIMAPYDIHDPAMDPMATEDSAKAIANSGFGSAYTSHFDMTTRITGVLELAGKSLPVNCIATMDHSWGPRPETGLHPILWVNGHFEPGYALHGIFSYDPHASEGSQHDFKHGYALIDGVVKGATAGSALVTRDGLYPRWAEVKLTDIDGQEHVMAGEMLNHHPWIPYGNNLGPMSLARWEHGTQGTGHGVFLEGIPLNRMRQGQA